MRPYLNKETNKVVKTSSWEGKGKQISEFKANLIYILSSSIASQGYIVRLSLKQNQS